MAHEQHSDPNTVGNRVLLPLLLPLAAAVVTGVLIVVVGNLLLAVRGMYDEHDAIAAQAPVAVALVLALIVLGACTVAAATWGRARR